ncbi:MAG TPA: VIT domain-containing protein [Oculatellaceae cyanobacterium]
MSQVTLLDKTDEAKRALGCLEVASGTSKLRLPLKGVSLEGRVADRLAHVTVTETFSNPYKEHLEAVYIFPLSGGCAVSSFEMRVGDRVIEGKVDERSQARQQYSQAIAEGKRAALLEQEREDVFTVQVGNLPPEEEVTVTITYSERLPYFADGSTELRLPLVVAPRYIPGDPLSRDSVGDGIELDTDRVPDASRISPPRLAEGLDPQIALTLKVVLEGDKAIEDLSCSQHATKMGSSKDGITVSLAREDELLNRDFVLRWRVATDSIQSKFLVYKKSKSKDCFGMLSLVPPKCTDIALAPRDVIFVVDRSGSMMGIKMASAARACSYLLSTLSPTDRFAIESFDNLFDWMPTGTADKFIEADEAGIERGTKFLRTITARGGTELNRAMQEAIDAMSNRAIKTGRQPVVVILTDGEVGNESEILASLQNKLGDLRVFTVGIDTAVNDGFLRKLASIGGGTSSFVQPGTQLEDALAQVSREIGVPLIQDLSVEDINSGLHIDSMAPERIPDLFEGRASAAFFQLSGAKLKNLNEARIRVKGKFANGSSFDTEVAAQVIDLPALAQLWAKSRILELEDKYRVEVRPAQKEDQRKQIIAIAIEHSVLTKFTAFVVVDEKEIVDANGELRKVVQPVMSPQGWEMEATDAIQVTSAAPRYRALYSGPAQPASGIGDAWGSGISAASQSLPGGWGAPAQIPPPSQSPPRSPQVPPDPDFFPESGTWRAFAPMEPKKASPERKSNLKEVFQRLTTLIEQCFKDILNGIVPNVDKLEGARTDLINELTISSIAGSVPEVQKFLRSDLVKLIAAISHAKNVTSQLQTLSAETEKTFKSFADDFSKRINPTDNFWLESV